MRSVAEGATARGAGTRPKMGKTAPYEAMPGVCVGRKLNPEQKRARRVGEAATFVQRYARKARRNKEPNDRRYDRGVEKRLKRMDPEELDRLLRDDG